MLASLDGLDAVVVSGGVGAHVPALHAALQKFLDAFSLAAPVLAEEAREDWGIALSVVSVVSGDDTHG